MTDRLVNLLDFSRADMERFFAGLGEKPYHARQVMRWIYQRDVDRFDAMTDLSKSLRATLTARATLAVPDVIAHEISRDGTHKWLLRMGGGQAVETVFIPETSRGTLCISSQVGCALDCSFCATGAQGFNRNLTTAEIVGQVWLARKDLRAATGGTDRITNVVLMGMGEPLANYRNVVPALRILLDDFGFELSRRRVTLSTSGLVPMIRKLADDCNVALAVSLHAPADALRDTLVPINRVHPIGELLAACWDYAGSETGRHVTFEYVCLDGVNDSPDHARKLAALLRGRPAKVNLIPFNPFPGTAYRCSPREVIRQFQNILLQAGVRTTTRKTRGDDIDAACGQLAGRVRDRTTARLGSKASRAAAG